ncbi:hypothetical protein COCON_G00200570 [Conger conger]|uniref:Uncharacterized protein n=1 Tax=Conger conger TaxID=82655 RepID=A0A9Q1D2U6_CONCO|nr:hypothetical protein COCON_G00200570 [Conger conger]
MSRGTGSGAAEVTSPLPAMRSRGVFQSSSGRPWIPCLSARRLSAAVLLTRPTQGTGSHTATAFFRSFAPHTEFKPVTSWRWNALKTQNRLQCSGVQS